MLTADLVEARRYKGELRLRKLEGPLRDAALEIAQVYLALAEDHVGRTREELSAAWEAVRFEVGPRLLGGVRKLVEDECGFDAEPECDPEDLRKAVFERACAIRQSLPPDGTFRRDDVLTTVATERGLEVKTLERLLYADLRGAHILRERPTITAESLVLGYDLAQAQAVLLRAVRVSCVVRSRSASVTRAFFRKVKFLRLLHTVEETDEGAYKVEIDGPFSLFQSVTKYGLKLALLVPALAELDAYTLEAELLWGKERERLHFRLESQRARNDVEQCDEPAPAPERTAMTPVPPTAAVTRAPADKSHRAGDPRVARRNVTQSDKEPHLADDVRALLDGLRAQDHDWKPKPASAIFNLPGVGLCIPDLVFTKKGSPKVYLEVMGYWSRDAVFRRTELVERGFRERVLFAVSSRLRVSEAVLADDASSALYVYKGTMSPRSVLERVERLANRGK